MPPFICRLACKLAFWRRDKKRAVAETAPSLAVVPCPENWRGVASVAVGTKHLKAQPPVPCQDAAVARAGAGARPCAFVADGAGSASLSHFGAQEAVLRLSHLSAALEDIHARMLDGAESPSEEECNVYARRFLIHASETLRGLSDCKRRPFKEFRCTLLAAIVGAERIFWMKVGDGQIVKEKNGEDLQAVGPSGKGEYANITRFVEENPEKTVFAAGVFSSAEISGIALMTDGAAEKLVSSDGKRVAPRIAKFFTGIRQKEFGKDDLHNFLSDLEVWKPPGYTGDDKGIALLSREK
ncbi:MAG: PP2C family serine/threonine-protein phosphatase [Gammaproteobacteria bacterium]